MPFHIGVTGDVPTVPIAGADAAAEGSPYTVTFGAVSPAVPVGGFTIDWGDGTPAQSFVGSPAGLSKSHAYADGPAGRTISVDLVAGGLTFPAAGRKAVTVTDVAPTVALSGPPSVAKGATYTLTLGPVTDPGRDSVTAYVVHWGDGTADTYPAGGDVTHVYTRRGSPSDAYVVTVDLVDEDGTHATAGTQPITTAAVPPTIAAVASDGPVDADGATATGTTTVTVRNAAPRPTITSVGAVRREGTAIAATGSATDPAGANDTVTLSWAVYRDGAATALATGGGGAAFAFTPPDNGTYRIVPTAADEDGGSTHADQTVVVTNVDVSFAAGADEDLPWQRAGAFARTIAFTDPGADTWSGTVDYGDGGGAQPLVVDPVAKTLALAHTYAAEGTYPVTVTLRDDDGNPVAHAFAVTVHFNAPPVVGTNGPAVTVQKGQAGAISGTFSDPQGNTTATLTGDMPWP